MRCERNVILNSFLNNEELIKRSGITKTELANVDFTKDSGNLLVEVLKAMIFTYCNDGAELTVQRAVQAKLAAFKKYERGD